MCRFMRNRFDAQLREVPSVTVRMWTGGVTREHGFAPNMSVDGTGAPLTDSRQGTFGTKTSI